MTWLHMKFIAYNNIHVVEATVCVVVLAPSHRMRGAIAVLVRLKPQWHRHDRCGSAMVPSLIAVPARKTVKTAALRGGTA